MAVKRGGGTCVKRKSGLFQASLKMGLDAEGRLLRPTAYGRTASAAQEALRKKVADIKRGQYKRPDPLTLGKYMADLLESRRTTPDVDRLRESTYQLYEGVHRLHIEPHLGSKRLDKVTRADVEALYKKLREKSASDRTVKTVHVVLLMMFGRAMKNGKIIMSPMTHVNTPTYAAPERVPLTPEEANNFLTTAAGDPLFALYVLALDSGARQGELFALRRADIDLKNRTITIRRSVRHGAHGELLVTKTKTGRDRIVPISTRSAQALRSHLKANMDSAWVFTAPDGGPLRKENVIRKSFRPLLKRAGLPVTLHFHDIRHSTATRLLIQGVHPKVVQDRLGHSSITVTLDTYSHAIPSLGREAADMFDIVASAE